MSLSDRLAQLQPRPPRILVLDIETAPALVYAYDLRTEYINPSMIVEPSRVLCFAAKWHGDSRTMFYSEWTHGRSDMIDEAWRLLDEADIVVTYNGVRFDVPHLQREMLLEGCTPPAPWIDVDLLQTVRREFKFMSARLGYVVEQLGLDAKGDPGGFDTWRGVLHGIRKAQTRMEKYNRQDVVITDQLFAHLRATGWLRMPHAGLFGGSMHACHACGSTRLTPDGIARTRMSAWLRLSCSDCGAHNRLLDNGETRPA